MLWLLDNSAVKSAMYERDRFVVIKGAPRLKRHKNGFNWSVDKKYQSFDRYFAK